jgi:OPT oligopeptide transporter protein
MITGPVIPLHMLAGTIVGWGILSPIAKRNGWAPGAVGDWDKGSRGWTLWIALSALIMDCLINLLWMTANLRTVRDTFAFIWTWMHSNSQKLVFNGADPQRITNINYTNPAEVVPISSNPQNPSSAHLTHVLALEIWYLVCWPPLYCASSLSPLLLTKMFP